MAKTHTTKQDHGDGTHTERVTTHHDGGGSKTVERDITHRTLLHDGDVISVTHTDGNGNSKTERYR